MKIIGAYGLVVLIWSTTPLAIHWSNSSLTFVAAITLRMSFALVLCFGLLKLMREPLIQHKRDWLTYCYSALGLFPNMLLVYWTAQYIPSGLMSVIMGIYPFFVGIFAIFLLNQQTFTMTKTIALVLAILGLFIIQNEQTHLGIESFMAVLVLVVVCVIWGFSSVMVKKLALNISALRMGTGSLLVATPFFILTWAVIDGEMPTAIGSKSIWSLGYLVVAGSLLGHTLWFYILRTCSVMSVSMIPLITPILAINWGLSFANEEVTPHMLAGTFLVLIALGTYLGVFKQLVNRYKGFE
jgi:probable blue pigment (indigoidine) exporter